MLRHLTSFVPVLVFTVAAAFGQSPPGACETNDGSFSTREGGCQDQVGNLVWSSLPDSFFTWAGASSYCSNLVEGGFSDWRLPTRNELVAADQHGAATHLADPADMMQQNYLFWSSTTQGNKAYAHNFATDANPLLQKTSFVPAYCVRNGLPAGGSGFAGSGPASWPTLQAMQVLAGGTWTTTVHSPACALRPYLFVAGVRGTMQFSVLSAIPGLVDPGSGVFDVAGRARLVVDLAGLGVPTSLVSELWLGVIVLEPTGPVLYSLN